MYRNTTTAYGSVAKVLHWLMALWFLLACLIILYLTRDHTEGPVPGLNYHKVVGFSLLLPLLLCLNQLRACCRMRPESRADAVSAGTHVRAW